MSEKLARLPWVDSDSIKTDAARRQARFAVKDRSKFSMDEIKKALGPRYGYDLKLLTQPAGQ